MTKDLDPLASLEIRPSAEFQVRTFRFGHSCEGMSESEIETAPKIRFIRRQFGLCGSSNRDLEDEFGLA
jgi:hypothetical protein